MPQHGKMLTLRCTFRYVTVIGCSFISLDVPWSDSVHCMQAQWAPEAQTRRHHSAQNVMQINASMTQYHVCACNHDHCVHKNNAASLQIFMAFCMDSTVITTCTAKESLGNTSSVSSMTSQMALPRLSFCCFLLQDCNSATQAYVVLVWLG